MITTHSTAEKNIMRTITATISIFTVTLSLASIAGRTEHF